MEWKTRVTEIFGCQYPILEGAYGGFGKWQFAAAISEAGALGMITAGSSRTPQRLREDIRKCRDATDKPFAVNITLMPTRRQINWEEYISAAIEEGVNIIETSGRSPDPYMELLKAAKVI